jgi:outer membrane protein assembly factor BamB
VYDKETLLTKYPETHVLTALDLATGKRNWEQQVDIKFATEWLVDAGRILYIPPVESAAGNEPAQSIVALDAATGVPAWRFDAMQVDDTLLLRGGCLFIFDTGGNLLCLDVSDGRIRGSYPGVPAAELGAAGADAIRTRITDEAFYQLSPAGVLRTYTIPQPTLAYSIPLAFEGVPDALDVRAGRAFVRTRLGETMTPKFYVFALPSGQLLWDAPDTGRLAQVVSHNGRQYALIFRSNDNDATPGVMVFDLTTGEKLHVVDALNHEYWVSPGGRLITYIGAGQLVAHDLATGEQLWSAKSDSNGVVTIGGQGDAVYLVASNTPFMSVTDDVNRLEVFDAQSGELLWRIKEGFEVQVVPDAPYLLAGDAGRLALYPLSR